MNGLSIFTALLFEVAKTFLRVFASQRDRSVFTLASF